MSRLRDPKYRVGAWPLNGHADDVSGYGMGGTLVNAPTWAENQFTKQCIELDGDDAHVNVGDLTYLNSVSAFTIAFWMNQDVLGVTDHIFIKGSVAGTRLRIISLVTPALRFEVTGNVNYGAFNYTTIISASSWYHVAMVFDGAQTGDANRLIVYVDGTPVTLAFTGTIPAVVADLSGHDAHIGESASSFDGTLSDFQIFNIPLSREEIKALMLGHS